mmetsp:Transcript_145745/g.254421  ORF Transcript_145745/g.254421 Transcript_145745/m.254421 type:complete len:530 (-) Transcript_145745:308-1897(-)
MNYVSNHKDDPMGYLLNLIERKGANYRNVLLPETIVYEHNFPRAWYCYEGETLFRRLGKDVTDSQSLYHALTQRYPNHNPDAAVAIYVSYADALVHPKLIEPAPGRYGSTSPDKVKYTVARNAGVPSSAAAASALQCATNFDWGDDKFNILYLTRSQLKLFLLAKQKGERGILQAYVPPRGKHNDVIKATWTQGICMIHRRWNRNVHTDRSLEAYDRNVVEKPKVWIVQEAQIAPVICAEITRVLDQIAEDIKAVEDQQVEKLVMFFKVDQRRVLNLMFCPLIELKQAAPKKSIPVPTVQTHLNFRHDFDQHTAKGHGHAGSAEKHEPQKSHYEGSHFHQLQRLKSVRNKPMNIQYQFFKTSLLPVTNHASPLLSTAALNPLACPSGLTPKQSLLLQRFEKLVQEVELDDQRSLKRRSRPTSACRPASAVPAVMLQSRSALTLQEVKLEASPGSPVQLLKRTSTVPSSMMRRASSTERLLEKRLSKDSMEGLLSLQQSWSRTSSMVKRLSADSMEGMQSLRTSSQNILI